MPERLVEPDGVREVLRFVVPEVAPRLVRVERAPDATRLRGLLVAPSPGVGEAVVARHPSLDERVAEVDVAHVRGPDPAPLLPRDAEPLADELEPARFHLGPHDAPD